MKKRNFLSSSRLFSFYSNLRCSLLKEYEIVRLFSLTYPLSLILSFYLSFCSNNVEEGLSEFKKVNISFHSVIFSVFGQFSTIDFCHFFIWQKSGLNLDISQLIYEISVRKKLISLDINKIKSSLINQVPKRLYWFKNLVLKWIGQTMDRDQLLIKR